MAIRNLGRSIRRGNIYIYIHITFYTYYAAQYIDLHKREVNDPSFTTSLSHAININVTSGWWFQTFFIFTPTWGNDPFWLIFFRWVETTNQTCFIFLWYLQFVLSFTFISVSMMLFMVTAVTTRVLVHALSKLLKVPQGERGLGSDEQRT